MTRRAVTLLETVAALALLALWAAAVVPVVIDMRSDAARKPRAAALAALSVAADGFMRSLSADSPVAPEFVTPDMGTIQVRRIPDGDSSTEASSEWLVFEMGDTRVVRWRPLRARALSRENEP